MSRKIFDSPQDRERSRFIVGVIFAVVAILKPREKIGPFNDAGERQIAEAARAQADALLEAFES